MMTMIFMIPSSFLLLGVVAAILFFASLNWAVIFAVLGLSALLLGFLLAWLYRNHNGMGIAAAMLLMLPGLLMWAYGVSLF